MRNLRQVLLGFGSALLSIYLVLGSFSLAFTEGGLVQVAWQGTGTMIPQAPQPPLTSVPLPGVTFTISPVPTSGELPLLTATLSPEAVVCPFPPGWFKITVQLGDTLAGLAEAYATTPEDLIQGNCLVTRNLIAGMVIYVPAAPTSTPEETCGPPPGWVYYTVQYGDTLYSISQMVGASIFELQLANCMVGQTNIRAGQRLYVPFVPASARTSTPTITSSPTLLPSSTPVQATNTPFLVATRTPTPSVTSVPENTSTSTVTVTPTATATSLPTATPTLMPTFTETPVVPPTETPTVGPVVP